MSREPRLTRGQYQCVMAWRLFEAMALDCDVRVDTTTGAVTGRVTSNEHHRPRAKPLGSPARPVEEINGARLAFWIAGQRIHLAAVMSVRASHA